MINSLIKLASKFAYEGEPQKADRLNQYILKCADNDEEPTMEDLMLEEHWLSEEGLDPDALKDEDAASGLAGHDRNVAEKYMQSDGKGLNELFMKLKQIQEDDVSGEMEQQLLMDQISALLMNKEEQPDELGLPFMTQSPMVGEASLLSKTVKLADTFDRLGRYKDADFFDKLSRKIAADGPDDFFGDEDDFDMYEDSDEDAPSDSEISELEGEEDDQFYQLLGFVSKVAEGMFMSLEAAQEEASKLIRSHDTQEGVYSQTGQPGGMQVQPDNVLEFPGQ